MHISNDTLHIAVADSSLIVRSGVIVALKGLIDAKLHIVEIATAEELGDCMNMHSPDMLIVNPSLLCGTMPGEKNISAIDKLKREFSGVRYVALLSSLEQAALTRGYDGVISIYDSSEAVASVLARVLERENVLGAYMAEENMDFIQDADPINLPFNGSHDEGAANVLSKREKEIVVCVVGGMTNKEIAERLFLSVHTVITHRKNISRKLQIHSVAALTIYAIANRLIDIADLD